MRRQLDRLAAAAGARRADRFVLLAGAGLAIVPAVRGLAEPPLPARIPAPPATESGRSFTPEERTNIAVYDAVNRSVVNINTKATVATMKGPCRRRSRTTRNPRRPACSAGPPGVSVAMTSPASD